MLLYFIVFLCARSVQMPLVFHIISAVIGDQYFFIQVILLCLSRAVSQFSCAMEKLKDHSVYAL